MSGRASVRDVDGRGVVRFLQGCEPVTPRERFAAPVQPWIVRHPYATAVIAGSIGAVALIAASRVFAAIVDWIAYS